MVRPAEKSLNELKISLYAANAEDMLCGSDLPVLHGQTASHQVEGHF